MNKRLDVGKVDAALKRAAQTAVSGSREERAGRFTVREADSARILGKDKVNLETNKGQRPRRSG